nr:putative EF-hand domain pair, reverse transcriptase, RNA-dependent DNA polymerase [Tanacetum cinerariifolium]
DTNVTAPMNVTGAPVTNTVANHAEKAENFNGQNFKRWQQKMLFYLTTLNLARFLNETAPQVKPPTEGQPSNAQAVQAVEAWKHSKFLTANETQVTALVNVTGVPVTNKVVNHAEKPEKFNGQNFKRWQQKMFFYLTTLNLMRFLKETGGGTS